MQLLDEQQRYGKKDHTRYPEGAKADIHSQQRHQRRQAYLRRHDMGLGDTAYQRDDGIKRRQGDTAGNIAG